jgi:hypothetical protein
MQLLAALKRVAPVLHKERPYVRCDGHTLTAGDGQQWIVAPVDDGFPFCVAHQALLAALERQDATFKEDGTGGVVVKSGRSRTTVRAVDEAFVPFPTFDKPQGRYDFAAGFRAILNTMTDWIDSEAATWFQGVHCDPNIIWAANPHEFIRHATPEDLFEDEGRFTIPVWALKTIKAAKIELRGMTEYERGLALLLDDGSTLWTRKLSEDPPQAALSFIGSIPQPTMLVPTGLATSLHYLARAGCRNAIIGAGGVSNDQKEESAKIEIDEELGGDAIAGELRRWNITQLQRALGLAERLDLTKDRGDWAGGDYVGAMMAMRL